MQDDTGVTKDIIVGLGEGSPLRDIGRGGDMARLSGGATNCNKMIQHHVLDVGLNEGSLLMQGIDEGIIIEDKI